MENEKYTFEESRRVWEIKGYLGKRDIDKRPKSKNGTTKIKK